MRPCTQLDLLERAFEDREAAADLEQPRHDDPRQQQRADLARDARVSALLVGALRDVVRIAVEGGGLLGRRPRVQVQPPAAGAGEDLLATEVVA